MTSGNPETVEEVVKFAEEGPLLRPGATVGGERVRVIHDFEEAKEFAYHRYLTDDEDAMNWTDLRERQAAKAVGAIYSDPAKQPLYDQAAALDDRLAAAAQRLPPAYAEVCDDVVADLHNCVVSRMVFGAGDRLFDRVWDAYRRGGWPCGWVGAFPDGELVVFVPPA